MSIINQLGYIAIGTRFRMITERLMQDADKIYKSMDLDFEPRLFIVFYLINQRKQITTTELAEQLGYSQPAITQIVNILLKKKIIRSVKSKNDSRKKVITIAPKGDEMLLKLIPIWQEIENSAKDLFSATGYDILLVLDKIESELAKKTIYNRVIDKIKENQRCEVTIREYDPAHKELFRDLNYEWLNKYFVIEEKDKLILGNPEEEILGKGGYIFFAEYENEIAGTVALIKHGENEFELSKMAVTEKFQGKQIGKSLGLAAIEKVRSLNADVLFLETNSTLIPALSLYKKLGFNQVEMKEKSDYKRATLRMELDLKKEIPVLAK